MITLKNWLSKSNLTNPSNKHWMHTKYFKSIKNACPSGQLMKEMASFYWVRLKSRIMTFEWETKLESQVVYKPNRKHNGQSHQSTKMYVHDQSEKNINTSITCSFFSITKPASKIYNMQLTKVTLKKYFFCN